MQYTMLTKPERYPDLLRDRAGTYLERDGFCFAPLLETTPTGACVLAVYFQNRCEGAASARLVLRPPRRLFGLLRHALPEHVLSIECPGGAFGVARSSFPIPARYQGRQVSFNVVADVTYPHGRGAFVRHRTGTPDNMISLLLPQGVAEVQQANSDDDRSAMIWWPALLEAEQQRLAA
jgi:hypothetical protein